MTVCYVDESGNAAQDPCLVMVGVSVDADGGWRHPAAFQHGGAIRTRGNDHDPG